MENATTDYTAEAIGRWVYLYGNTPKAMDSEPRYRVRSDAIDDTIKYLREKGFTVS